MYSDSKCLTNRLTNELRNLSRKEPEGITVLIEDAIKDLYCWRCVMLGLEETPYQDHLYHLEITFPVEYPFKAPRVRFTTPIFHPNVTTTGNLFLNLLVWDWSPALTTDKLLMMIRALLKDPHIDDMMIANLKELYPSDSNNQEYEQVGDESMNVLATKLFLDDRRKYDEYVQRSYKQRKFL